MSELQLRQILEAEIKGNMFKVVVSNFVGTVYEGEDEKRAYAVFQEYVKKSDQGFGSVGHETVSLLLDEVMVQEYQWIKPQ